MSNAKTQRSVNQVVGLLEAGVGSDVSHDALQAAVEADFERFDDARIKDFVPVLVENDMRARIMRVRAD